MPAGVLDKEWNLSSYIAHNETVRRLENELDTERDRRYAEVNVEKEKALKIKETADRDALDLARERQREKDAQSDALRDKTLSESGIYATNASVSSAMNKLENKLDSALAPLAAFMAAQGGATTSSDKSANRMSQLIAAIVGLGLLYLATK